MFLDQQISIFEWFLKDPVALKTWVMMLKIQLYNHRNKLHFKIYSNQTFSVVMLLFFFFYNIPVLDCIFNQINEAINQKHKSYQPFKLWNDNIWCVFIEEFLTGSYYFRWPRTVCKLLKLQPLTLQPHPEYSWKPKSVPWCLTPCIAYLSGQE